MIHRLEPMAQRHRASVIEIFNHYVIHGFAAYPEKPVDEAFFERILEITEGYPALVIEDESGYVIGFGFLHAFRPSATFRHTAQISYFLRPEHTRQGLGTQLLERLKHDAKQQGIQTLLANISSLNEQSLRFHRKYHFKERGRLRHSGIKHGQPFDVVWMQLDL
jgi:phosphinothricin acetyltransferase